MTTIRKLYVLLCGYEILAKTISTRDRGARFMLCEPISAYLLEGEDGYTLVDAGVNSTLVNDPALCYSYYTSHGWTPPVVNPQHELVVQLAEIGIAPEQVKRVVLTHMHMDHTGNLKHFRHARIMVQRREYEYAFSNAHDPAWFDADYDLPGLHWDVIDGDHEIVPGMQAITTFGHTSGHQSLVVELPETGTVILAGDVGDLQENFDDEVLPGIASDAVAALASIRRLKQIVAERNAQLFLCHDPQLIQRLRLAPTWYG